MLKVYLIGLFWKLIFLTNSIINTIIVRNEGFAMVILDNVQLRRKVSELEDKIKSQDRGIKKRDKQKEELLTSKEKLQRELGTALKDLKESQKKGAELEEELTRLKSCIDDISQQKQSLEESLQKYTEHTTDINTIQGTMAKKFEGQKNHYKGTISSLKEENQKLLRDNEVLRKKNETLEYDALVQCREQRRQELIFDILIQELYKHPINVVQAQEMLSKAGFSLTNSEVDWFFSELKKRYHIQGPNFETIPPFYKIDTSLNLKKSPILINTPNANYIDKFYWADTHANPCTDINISYLTDQVNNYCAKNSVPYIFHLGDFFSLYKKTKVLTVENLKLILSFLEKVRKEAIICSDFYYGFLGGNHDRHFHRFGIDPIENFIEGRENCFSLGYDHAIVMLKNKKNCIHLHHSSTSIRQDEEGNIDVDIEKFYRHSNVRRSDIYFDYLGHFHMRNLNFDNGYGLVSSLNYDQKQNGAMHVRFYFDRDGNIDYMVIKDLKLDKKLEQIDEHVYDKKRMRQKQ